MAAGSCDYLSIRLQGLVAVCCVHHAGHAAHALGWHEHAHTPLMALLGSPGVSAGLGAVALLGPGRKLLTSGVSALLRCLCPPCRSDQLAAPTAWPLVGWAAAAERQKSVRHYVLGNCSGGMHSLLFTDDAL